MENNAERPGFLSAEKRTKNNRNIPQVLHKERRVTRILEYLPAVAQRGKVFGDVCFKVVDAFQVNCGSLVLGFRCKLLNLMSGVIC